jgi:TetR/AcrR family transcriptional regulator, transcriptional repressor for nem operon
MGINAICEFGRSDPEITLLEDPGRERINAVLVETLRRAKRKKEIVRTVNETEAAHFILATLTGLKVAAKDGAEQQALKDIADFALRSLTTPG